MNDVEIEDAEFEEIEERAVILTSELSDSDLAKIAMEETSAMSPEDAAAFAKELEKAQTNINSIQVTDEKEQPLTQRQMMSAINNAVKEGILSKSRKQSMLNEVGIFKSTFTKKSSSSAEKTKKRKIAKTARRKNRK